MGTWQEDNLRRRPWRESGTFALRVIGIELLAVLLGIGTSVRVAFALQNGSPVIAAAGDLACDPENPYFNGGNGNGNSCMELSTSQRLQKDSTVDLVLGLGDVQYECDDMNDYPVSYGPSWGAFNPMMAPVAGNHEYQTGTDPYGEACPSTNTTAANYFAYFGASANPDKTQGWYSFDLGTWHIIALNANCGSVGGCGSSSPETKWLTNDLNATSQACILAYWHQPRWTGLSTNSAATATWWNLLYNKHTDVILNGHVHNYQRFPKLNPSGSADSAGILEIIAGTGGRSLQAASTTANPKPTVALKAFGYLRMVLQSNSYAASFIKYDGTVLDSFSGTCN